MPAPLRGRFTFTRSNKNPCACLLTIVSRTLFWRVRCQRFNRRWPGLAWPAAGGNSARCVAFLAHCWHSTGESWRCSTAGLAAGRLTGPACCGCRCVAWRCGRRFRCWQGHYRITGQSARCFSARGCGVRGPLHRGSPAGNASKDLRLVLRLVREMQATSRRIRRQPPALFIFGLFDSAIIYCFFSLIIIFYYSLNHLGQRVKINWWGISICGFGEAVLLLFIFPGKSCHNLLLSFLSD